MGATKSAIKIQSIVKYTKEDVEHVRKAVYKEEEEAWSLWSTIVVVVADF